LYFRIIARPMPPDEKLPPELRTISREEFRQVYATAARIALGIMRNRDAADRLMSDAFEALMTTRRWNPERGALLDHVAGILKSIRSNQFHSKAPERDRQARRDFQREEIGTKTASPEDRTLEHTEREASDREAETELEELARSVADQPLARSVLEKRLEATKEGTPKRAGDVAAELGVPVKDVYKANDVLRDHLRAIRRRRGTPESEGE
jgi:hypothetical protein